MNLPKSEKGLAHILVLLILLLTIPIGVYLVGHPAIFNPHAAANRICRATDPVSLKDCVNQLNNSQTDNVEIDKLIICSGRDSCQLPEITTQRLVNIYGLPNAGAGIKRLDNYNYKIIQLKNASNLNISNLTLDDVTPSKCSDGVCQNSLISISGGSNISLDNITLKNSQYMGLAASQVKDLTVKNSKFINNGWFGIWTDRVEGMVIENNLIQDNLSNGLLGTFTGSSTKPSLIKNNTFLHNHRDIIFFVCGGETGACPGGQIDITSPTEHLTLEGNLIKNGKIDNWHDQGFFASGLELNGDTHFLTVKNNVILNNTGSAVSLNAGSTNTSDINFNQNILSNNLDNAIDYPGANIGNNCLNTNCQIPSGLGFKEALQELPENLPIFKTDSAFMPTTTASPSQKINSKSPSLTISVSVTPLSSPSLLISPTPTSTPIATTSPTQNPSLSPTPTMTMTPQPTVFVDPNFAPSFKPAFINPTSLPTNKPSNQPQPPPEFNSNSTNQSPVTDQPSSNNPSFFDNVLGAISNFNQGVTNLAEQVFKQIGLIK